MLFPSISFPHKLDWSRLRPPASLINPALTYTRYATPVILLIAFTTLFLYNSIKEARKIPRPLKGRRKAKRSSRIISPADTPPTHQGVTGSSESFSGKKLLSAIAAFAILLTFLGNAAVVVSHAIQDRHLEYWCGEAFVVYVVGASFVHSLILTSLIEATPSPSALHAATWLIALVLECFVLTLSCLLYSGEHREGRMLDPNGGRLLYAYTGWEKVEVCLMLARILLLALPLSLYFARSRNRNHEQTNGYFGHSHTVSNGVHTMKSYQREKRPVSEIGSPTEHVEVQHEEQAAWLRPEKLPSVSWWHYITNYSLFLPFLWPANSPRLKVTFTACVILLVLGRCINVLVPYQVGKVINLLTKQEEASPAGLQNIGIDIPWVQITVLAFYSLLQGNSGLIGTFRQMLWMPIGQFSSRELAVAIFEHVHKLGFDFHMDKQTGELVSAMNKGGSINTFLDTVTFSVAPNISDLVIAMVYFAFAFDIYYTLITVLVAFWYIFLTVRIASRRGDAKREVTNLQRQEEAVKQDSIGLYETVKYFNGEDYENDRYRDVFDQYQEKELALNNWLCFLSVTQNTCFMLGLMLACFLAALQIHLGLIRVGKFVSLLTYLNQLRAPLNNFSSSYKSIQSSMINAERILELFRIKASVVDEAHAKPMTTCEGKVRFRNVTFAYGSRKSALDGLDFECRPGTRTALVGASGVGKSTVLRLLYRFYDVTDGAIEIDDQNVADITIDSLRSHIGVVPQETNLFNESIMYNLKYAKKTATNEEVIDACKAACIHDKIMQFPHGYDSAVGERGVKLSGGERQRIAIARMILKNPRLILLDEATAALDGETEQILQDSVTAVSQGRTTIVIAHRLSTIISSDQILVMSQGEIVEKGTHTELLALNQRYARMWKRTCRSERVELKALALHQKADKLKKRDSASDVDSSSTHSEEDSKARSTPVEATDISFKMTNLVDGSNS